MPYKDPAVRKAHQAEWSLERRLAAERKTPPHRCEYVDDAGNRCTRNTRIARIGPQGEPSERSRFCRKDGHGLLGSSSPEERQRWSCPGAVRGGPARRAQLERDPDALANLTTWAKRTAERDRERLGLVAYDQRFKEMREKKPTVLSGRLGYGPQWRKVIGKKVSKTLTGRTLTAAERDGIARGRANRKQPLRPASRGKMLLLPRTRRLRALPALDLLVVEDLAVEPDAIAYVRQIRDGLKGHRIAYTLDAARQAGPDARRIAEALDLAKSQAYEVLKRIHLADALRAHGATAVKALDRLAKVRTGS